MSRWILACVIAVAMSTAACGSSSDSKPQTDNTQITTADGGGAAGAGGEPDSIAVSDGEIEALQVDGVWVFRHEPNGGMSALHQGEAAIVDSCLLVGGCVMVWPLDRFGEAEDAIAAVRGGEVPTLSLGGGGQSLEEDGVLPSVVVDHCQTSCVFYVSPVVR